MKRALLGIVAMAVCMPVVLVLFVIDARERVLEEAGR